MGKRGQFFLLAAVIISAVIISLGAGTNRAVVNKNPDSFYDFSYEVKREVGSVFDYEVYTGFDDDVNLTEFVDLLAEEIEERSPGSDFIFIYGNGTDLDLKNYGSESIYAGDEEIVGLGTDSASRICMKEWCQEINQYTTDFESPVADLTLEYTRIGSEDILVEIGGSDFEFPISEHNQVIFIMQKEVDGDRHVVVE